MRELTVPSYHHNFNSFNTNLLIVALFIFINPIYVLFFISSAEYGNNKPNDLLVSILFIVSFVLLFSNQNFIAGTDLANYLSIYRQSDQYTFSALLERYLDDVRGKEVLWWYYSKLIGLLTEYSIELYILITYLIIFSLCTYLVYLISENGRHSIALMLFFLVFVDLTILYSAYNMWRNTIAVLLLLIGIASYGQSKSKTKSRIIIYSSMIVHTSMIPVVIMHELFLIFIRKQHVNTNIYYFNTLCFVAAMVAITYFISPLFYSYMDTPFQSGIDKYMHSVPRPFVITDYLRPVYFLFLIYVVINFRSLKTYEVFIVALFIYFNIIFYSATDMGILYGRANLVVSFASLLLIAKLFIRFDYIYTYLFVMIFFVYRMLFYVKIDVGFPLENIAKGDFLNINQGIAFLIYNYDPIFTNL